MLHLPFSTMICGRADAGPQRATAPHARKLESQDTPLRENGREGAFAFGTPNLVDYVPAPHVVREAALT